MKHGLFIIPFLFLTLGLRSQTWAPEYAKWTYTKYSFVTPGVDTLTIRSIGDTVIAGKTCRILHKSGSLCDLRDTVEYMYTDSSKVYFYDQLRDTFQMLYNFDAQVGDTYTVFVGTSLSFLNDSINIIVDSVSTITINSILLRQLFVHSTNQSTWSYFGSEIIENIGDVNFMFPWTYGACDANFAQPLRCYQDTIIGFHDFGTALSCDYVDVGIKEQRLDDVNIYPNPATNNIEIKGSIVEESEVNIYDVLGNLVLQCVIRPNETTISTSSLAAGIYTVSIAGNEWNMQRKIIIE